MKKKKRKSKLNSKNEQLFPSRKSFLSNNEENNKYDDNDND